MKYVLFVMLLTAPPHDPKVPVNWVLTRTNAIEFDSGKACETARSRLAESVSKVNTIAMRGLCLAKGDETEVPAK